jgi:hypothetical protein
MRFGPYVVSEAMWRETPAELHYLRGARAAVSSSEPGSPGRGRGGP